MTNEMLKLCINQGYVPSDCKLDGMLVFLLVGDGKNPCDGCNANCVHRTCKCKNNYTNCEDLPVFWQCHVHHWCAPHHFLYNI